MLTGCVPGHDTLQEQEGIAPPADRASAPQPDLLLLLVLHCCHNTVVVVSNTAAVVLLPPPDTAFRRPLDGAIVVPVVARRDMSGNPLDNTGSPAVRTVFGDSWHM